MKQLALTIILLVALLTGCNNKDIEVVESVKSEAIEASTSDLDDNQTYLYYSHSDSENHYFIDPNYDGYTIVGVNDWMIDSSYTINTDSLYEGKQFVGTFDIEYEWELLAIEEME